MQEKKPNVAELTRKALKTVVDETTQVSDASGINGKTVIASSSGQSYILRPLGIGKISEITVKIQKLEAIMEKKMKEGKTENQIIMEANSPVLDIMAEIIQLGLIREQPNVTIEEIKDGFSLGDFPKVYHMVLDLNDFLSGMRTLLTQR